MLSNRGNSLGKDLVGVVATVAVVLILLWAVPAVCNLSMDALAWILGV